MMLVIALIETQTLLAALYILEISLATVSSNFELAFFEPDVPSLSVAVPWPRAFKPNPLEPSTTDMD
eukprot:g37227.t1